MLSHFCIASIQY